MSGEAFDIFSSWKITLSIYSNEVVYNSWLFNFSYIAQGNFR